MVTPELQRSSQELFDSDYKRNQKMNGSQAYVPLPGISTHMWMLCEVQGGWQCTNVHKHQQSFKRFS